MCFSDRGWVEDQPQDVVKLSCREPFASANRCNFLRLVCDTAAIRTRKHGALTNSQSQASFPQQGRNIGRAERSNSYAR